MDLPRKREPYGINPLSSKTYQIISRFGLLDNYCNVNLPSSIATPVEVVSSVLGFNKRNVYSKSKSNAW